MHNSDMSTASGLKVSVFTGEPPAGALTPLNLGWQDHSEVGYGAKLT